MTNKFFLTGQNSNIKDWKSVMVMTFKTDNMNVNLSKDETNLAPDSVIVYWTKYCTIYFLTSIK